MKRKCIAVLAACMMMLSAGQSVSACEGFGEIPAAAAVEQYAASAQNKESKVPAFDNEPFFCVMYMKDGSIKKLSDDETYKMSCTKEYLYASSKELYEEYFSEEMTYAEYKKELMDVYGITEKDVARYQNSSLIIYGECVNSDKPDDISYSKTNKAVFEYVRKYIADGKDKKLSELMKKGNTAAVTVMYSFEGDVIRLSAAYSCGGESSTFIYEEFITKNGESVYTIGGVPVPADTQSLYISAFDETSALLSDGFASQDYDTAVYELKARSSSGSNEAAVLDIKELAKNFPNLKKLSISSGIKLKNISYLAKFKNLKELRLDVEGCKDLSFLKKVKTERLVLKGLEASPKPLAQMKVKEISITCEPNKYMKEIYKLKKVTELTVTDYSNTRLDLNGIENMTGLRKLDISANPNYTLDLAPLSKLKNLTELEILAFHVKDLSGIAKLSSVKKLMLHSMDDEDLSFLSKMTGLEELRLYYVNDSFLKSLPKLTRVKEFVMVDIVGKADYSYIYKMKNLRRLTLIDDNVSIKGISSLKHLETLSLMLCGYGDLSVLKQCSSLKNLMIYNCTTPYFDADWIKGMKQLEYLDFNCSEIDNYKSLKSLKGLKTMNVYFCNLTPEQLKEIKKSIPECKIMTDIDEEVTL